ncbi:death-inducer obliterator 1-like isoform X2 [Lethenteron reissneri]|nr:death-inducer obliterator 1-like isoform X2 [Lethenteron reissneri]XP_061425053.1 death-inducer obliterator 1-like isoform X2 [Lethenteron reissneri]
MRGDASGGSESELQETASQPEENDEGVEEEGDNTEDEKKAKELRKTWGFRRSTLAQRDGESLSDSQEEKPMTRGRSSFTLQIMPRRSGRSTKRSPHVQAFLAPKSRSKKSSGSPANSGSSSPTSSRSTAGSPVKESKDKIDLSSDGKGSSKCDKDTVMSENKEAASYFSEMSINRACRDKIAKIELTPLPTAILRKEEDSALKPMCGSSEDDLPLKELQERLRKKKLEQQQMEARLGAVVETSKVTSVNSTPVADNKVNDVQHQNKSENEGLQDVAMVAAEDANTDDNNQSLGCTGNLLDHDYAFQKRTGCICGKNNFDRVQVLCKQCEEWIHGSCVGITVELALELEKDNKVYLCPRCCPMESDDEDPHTKGPGLSAKPASKGDSLDSKKYMGKLEQATEPSDPKRPRIKIQQEEPAKEPEPAAKDPEPAAKLPEPVAKLPEPAAKLPEPVTNEPEPAAKLSEPVANDPEPAAKLPEPVAKAPEPVAKGPESAAKNPEPAAKHPEPVEKDPEPVAKDPEPAEKQSEPATTESERSAKVSEPTEKETQPAPNEPEPASVSQKCVVVECSNNALAGSVYCSNECILKHAAAALQSMREDGAKQKDKKGKNAVKGKGGKVKDKKNKKKKKGLLDKSRDQSPAKHEKMLKSKLRSAKDDKSSTQKSKAGKIVKKSVAAAAASKDSKQAKESLPTDKGKGNPQASVTRTASAERSQEHSAVEVAKAAAKVDALKHTVKPGMKQATFKPILKVEGKLNVKSDNAKQLVKHDIGKSVVKQEATKPLIKQDISRPGTKLETSKPGFKPVVKHEMGKTVVKQEASKTVLKHEVGKTIFRPDKSVAGTPGVKVEKPTAASTAPKIEKTAVASTSSSHQVSKEKILHKETVAPSGSHPASSHQKNHPSVEQIRQNVRRTLKDILAKRCSDSDDLTVAEEELVKVAGRIEKELFLLFQATDSRYKGKVRGLILNLKDPKNQGLFRRVLVGDMTAPRLVRLSPEELASRELALWRERDSSKMMKRESWELERRHRHKVEVDMEESPPHPDSEEAEESVPEGCKTETAKADIMSSMLTDTTDQHKAHLFDLNCKICTGRMPPPSEEATAKKVKFSLPTASSASPTKRTDSTMDRPTTHPLAEPTPIADVSSPVATPASQVSTQAMQDSPEEPAAVSGGTPESVSASPTLVAFTAVPLPASAAEVIQEERSASPEPVKPPPIISVPVVSQEIEPQNNARLDSLWKGFVNMHGVAKVVAKAYPVSGSMANVAEELPDTIHVGGRILAKMVWDYVGKLKSSASKEVCIIRFHPATEEEAVAYISLYSYFNSRKRYGVVGNASKSLKDMYLIPLAAQDPIPHQLLPFDGPGLEPSRSHMLLGLVIKQKSKRRHQGDSSEGGAEYEKSSRNSPEEKKGKYSYDAGESSYSQRRESKKHRHKYEDTNVGMTPPDFPPPPPPPPPPVAQSNLLTKLFSDKASERPTTSASQQPMMKPLEHILKTLFGNKELPKETPKEPEKEKINLPFSAFGSSILPFSTKAGGFDSIIQHFSGAADVNKLNDDRPYDPEDAYDPEDETIFDEKKRVSETTPYVTLESLIPGLGNPESLFNSGELQKRLPGEQDIAPKIKETAAPQSYLMASRDPRQAANRNQLASSIPLPIFQIQEAVKPDVGKSSESSNFDVKSVVEAKPQELQVDLNVSAKEVEVPIALPLPPAVSLEVTDKVDTPVEEVSTPEASEMAETVSEPKAIEESSPAVEDTTVEHQKDPEATDEEMSIAEVPQDTEPILNKADKVQEDNPAVEESTENKTEEMSLEVSEDKDEVKEDDKDDLYDMEELFTSSENKDESVVEDADSASSNEQENATPESGKSEQKMDTQIIPSFIS